MLSPHPADPTLTTDNLLEVVKEVEHCWEELGRKLGFRKYVDGRLQLSGVHGMADVVDEYVRHYYTPSWKKVATALQRMKLDKLADEVTTKYVRGMDVNHVTCSDTEIKTSHCRAAGRVEVWLTSMSGAHMYDNILKVDIYIPSGPACNWVYIC